jgi:hypothetical protein
MCFCCPHPSVAKSLSKLILQSVSNHVQSNGATIQGREQVIACGKQVYAVVCHALLTVEDS